MPNLALHPRGQSLVPANRASAQIIETMKPGGFYQGELKARRNGKFHRLYWAMCQYMANALNAGPGTTAWDQVTVSDRLKIATGRCTLVQLPKALQDEYGTPVAVKPKSISFANMGQDEFSEFVTASVLFIIGEFGEWVTSHPDWQGVNEILAQAGMTKVAAE